MATPRQRADDFASLLQSAEDLLSRSSPEHLAERAERFPDLVAALKDLDAEVRALREDRDRAYQKLKTSQAQLVQSGKMAAVGQLAAGVAHEVNNPLQIILSRVQLLMIRHREKEGLVKDLRLVESNVKRISRIIRSLLDFARHNSGEEDRREIDLVYLVNQTINLMHHLLEKGGVEARLHAPEEPPVRMIGNVGEMEQVLLNLILNALQAMPEGGEISFELDTDGQAVTACIRDTGHGICEDHLSRIFDPFFTTREEEGGTGLGLSIIYGIVEKHGGEIEVESEIDRGTAFTLTFPAAPART